MNEVRPIFPRAEISIAAQQVLDARVRAAEGRWMLLIDDGGAIITGPAIAEREEMVAHANKFFAKRIGVGCQADAAQELNGNVPLSCVFWAAVEAGVSVPTAIMIARLALAQFKQNGITLL